MLEAIVNFLNLKLELLNYFEKRHCLSVLVQNDDGLIYPAEYISDGNYDAIDFDAFDGLSYLRVNGEINVDRIDQKYTPKPRVNVTFPLRLVYAVRKDKLTADDAYSFDRVRASIAKQLESDSVDLTVQLDADKVQISTSGYVSDAKEVWDEETNETGQFQPKFEVVFGAMEVNVVVTTRVECIPDECDDFESDILRTFDFCKPSVFHRLTPTQVSCLESEICAPCADATVEINGVEVGTVPSGGTDSFTVNLDGSPSGSWDGDSWEVTSAPCADATVQLNGVNMADIPSGDTENILVLQSDDMTQVGAKQGVHWRIADSDISVNGSPVGSVKAEDALDIDVLQDGLPVGSWNGTDWIVPSCPAGGGSISVAVSDTSPLVGETITITATPSDFTPDSYLYFVYDGAGEITFIAEQASNTFDWSVGGIDTGSYTIYVLGVESGTPNITAFGTVDITVASNFLLDTLEGSGANFAFAFFRLRADYTDPIALIRRSSDNAQKAFYLDTNNVLSLSSEDGGGLTLGDWITTDDGYLVTGYSQDTSIVTFTAANAADQQRIIIGGALVEINDAVAMVGNQDPYVISTSLTVNSAFVVAKNDAINLVNVVFGGNRDNVNFGGSFSGVTGIAMSDGSAIVQTATEDLNPHLASCLADTGVYVDGSLGASGTIADMTITRVAGRTDVATLAMNGKIACIVSYSTDKTADRAAIEANIDSNLTPSLLP